METGINTVEKIANADPGEFFKRLIEINEEKKYTKIMANLNDVNFAIEYAKKLPKAIEY